MFAKERVYLDKGITQSNGEGDVPEVSAEPFVYNLYTCFRLKKQNGGARETNAAILLSSRPKCPTSPRSVRIGQLPRRSREVEPTRPIAQVTAKM